MSELDVLSDQELFRRATDVDRYYNYQLSAWERGPELVELKRRNAARKAIEAEREMVRCGVPLPWRR